MRPGYAVNPAEEESHLELGVIERRNLQANSSAYCRQKLETDRIGVF